MLDFLKKHWPSIALVVGMIGTVVVLYLTAHYVTHPKDVHTPPFFWMLSH